MRIRLLDKPPCLGVIDSMYYDDGTEGSFTPSWPDPKEVEANMIKLEEWRNQKGEIRIVKRKKE